MADIDQLQGRELDVAVAREVMGWVRLPNRTPTKSGMAYPAGWEKRWRLPGGVVTPDLPRYSDDDAREWPAVLDAMEADGWHYSLSQRGGIYLAEFWKPGTDVYDRAEEDEVAEAVCRAALAAKRAAAAAED